MKRLIYLFLTLFIASCGGGGGDEGGSGGGGGGGGNATSTDRTCFLPSLGLSN